MSGKSRGLIGLVVFVVGQWCLSVGWLVLSHLREGWGTGRVATVLAMTLVIPFVLGLGVAKVTKPSHGAMLFALILGPLASTALRLQVDDVGVEWLRSNALQLFFASISSAVVAVLGGFAGFRLLRSGDLSRR